MLELSTASYDPNTYTFSYASQDTVLALAQSLGFQYSDKVHRIQIACCVGLFDVIV